VITVAGLCGVNFNVFKVIQSIFNRYQVFAFAILSIYAGSSFNPAVHLLNESIINLSRSFALSFVFQYQ